MSWFRSALHVALAASCGLNVWLAARVVGLESRIGALTARPGLSLNTRVSNLEVSTATGEKVIVRYADSALPTLLSITSPACPWCAKNRAGVRTLAVAGAGRFRVIGISLGGTRGNDFGEYVQSEEMPFPIYAGISDAASRELRVRSTPTTILIGPEGGVLSVWEGAYGGRTKSDIESYFNVQLPALPEGGK